MDRALVWDPHFATLPPALADRKLCEYTRVLQLTALEQRVYTKIEKKRAPTGPVGLWAKHLAWLTVAVLALFPMCVPQPTRHRRIFFISAAISLPAPHVPACFCFRRHFATSASFSPVPHVPASFLFVPP